MPIIGSLGVIAEIFGGEKVIEQLNKIKQTGEEASKSTVVIKADDASLNRVYGEIVQLAEKFKDVSNVVLNVKSEGGEEAVRKLDSLFGELQAKANIKVTIDTEATHGAGYQKSVEQQAAGFQRAVQQIEKDQQAYQKAVEQQAAGFQRAQQKLQQEQQKAAEARQKAVEQQATGFQKAIAQVKKDGEAYQKAVEEQAKGFQRAVQQIEKEKQAYQKAVESQAAGFQRAVIQVDKEQTEKERQATLAAQARYDAMVRGIGSVGNALTRLGGLWDATTASIGKFARGLEHAGQISASFAYRLAILTVPLDALLAKSVQFASDFEASMAKVATQLTDTLPEVDRYIQQAGDNILNLSKQYGVAANDISDALYFLVSSGVPKDLASQALEPITQLAVVGAAKAKDVAQATVAAFNVYGDELAQYGNQVQQAQFVQESFFETVQRGRFEVTDFATNYGRAAEQLKQANFSFNETNALLATLSTVFTPSQAVTAANSFAKALIDPTKEAKSALEEVSQILGHDVRYALEGNNEVLRNGVDITNDILGTLIKIAETDQRRALELASAIFGDIRGGRVAQFLLNPSSFELYNKNLKEITGNQEALGQAVEITERTLKNSFERLQGTFNAFANNIVQSNLAPALRGIITGLTALMENLVNNKEAVNVLTQMATALAIISPIALAFGAALLGVGGLVGAVAALLNPVSLLALTALFEQLAPNIQHATDAVKEFGGGINGVVGTVTELAYQLGLIDKQTAGEIFKQLGITVSELAKQDVGRIVDDLQELMGVVRDIGGGIITFANGIKTLIENMSRGEGIMGHYYTLIKGIVETLANLTGISGGNFTSENIANVLDKVIGTAVGLKIVGSVASVMGGVFGWLKAIGIVQMNAGVVNLTGGTPGQIFGAGKGLLTGGGAAASGTSGVLAFLSSAGGIAAITVAAVAVYETLAGKYVIEKGQSRLQEQGINPQNATFSQTFYAGLNKWADDIFKTLNSWGEDVARAWESARKDINAWADNLWIQIENSGNEFVKWISDAPKRLQDIFALAIGLASGQIQLSIGKWIIDSASAVGQSIYTAVVQFLSGGGIQNAIDQFFSNFGFAPPNLDRRYDAIEDIRGQRKALIGQSGATDIGNPITGNPNEFGARFGATDIGNPITGNPNEFGALGSAAQNAGQELFKTTYKLGGLTFATEEAANAAKAFAEAAYSAAQTVLGKIQGLVEETLTPTGDSKNDKDAAKNEKKLDDLVLKRDKLESDLRYAEQRIANAKTDAQRLSAEHSLEKVKLSLADVNEEIATLNRQGAGIEDITNKWDAFRLELEQIHSVPDAAKFGQRFLDQLKLITEKFPQFTQDQIIEKFKNFSLFADLSREEVQQLINFEPIEQQVQEKIDEIIGKFKVMREAVAKVISGLSRDKVFDLAQALGIKDVSADALQGQLQNVLTEMFTGVSRDPKNLVVTEVKVPVEKPKAALGEIGDEADKTKAKIEEPSTPKINAIPALNALELIQNAVTRLQNMIAAPFQIQVDTSEALKAMQDFNQAALDLLNPFNAIMAITEGEPIVPAPTPTEPPPSTGSDKERASGGYAWMNTLYRLGEKGREYVLNSGTTQKIEAMVGGMISSPAQIEGLIGGMSNRYQPFYNMPARGGDAMMRAPNNISIGQVFNGSSQDGDRLMSQLSWLGVGL